MTGSRQFTAAERLVMDANLEAAEKIVRKTVYGTPRGFAVQPGWHHGEGHDRGPVHGRSLVRTLFLLF